MTAKKPFSSLIGVSILAVALAGAVGVSAVIGGGRSSSAAPAQPGVGLVASSCDRSVNLASIPPAPAAQGDPCASREGDTALDSVAPLVGTEICTASVPNGEGADTSAKPQRHRFCRCSCGAPCTTSADCGGSSCDPFITCC